MFVKLAEYNEDFAIPEIESELDKSNRCDVSNFLLPPRAATIKASLISRAMPEYTFNSHSSADNLPPYRLDIPNNNVPTDETRFAIILIAPTTGPYTSTSPFEAA